MSIKLYKLLDAVTGTGAGTGFQAETAKRTFQATVTGTGALTATVKIQVSNDGTNYIDLATISLSGTTSATDGFSSDAPWRFVRGNVTALTGTSAAVTAFAGVEQ